jgi:DNA mismatch repair protein MutS2
MHEKTLTTLEFDKVLARLARHASFSAGRELALALRPSTNHAEVVRRQRLTAEARCLRAMKPSIGLGGAHDVRPLAHKASLGGILEPTELLDVASTLRAAQEMRSALTRLSGSSPGGLAGLPLLAELAEDLPEAPDLVADIARCINARAEVTDAASPVLAGLRRDVRIAHDRLNAKLQEILNSPLGRQVVQEPIVTLRDGRYVIPVKADFRGQMQGIVHDMSSSGATVFLEPLAVVDLGNTWRELQLEEEREVERVLRRLSAAVGAAADAIVGDVEGLAEIDLALAKARLADELDAHELPQEDEAQSWLVAAPAPLNLVNARHPLLTSDVVPISLSVGAGYSALLITGPNTGGKTVALKTTGLLSLMALAGLPVPADAGSQVPVFSSVHADIGDEQSIEQSLSTFSSHMTNIIGILKEAEPRSLILLDELGAGTDPTEGSALARSILQHLLAIGCLTVATTHHGELKVFAHATTGVMNASVEFDPETLAPTYRLSIGLPGHSNALAIAARLGLAPEVIEVAQASLAPDQVQVESLLADIQRQRQEAALERRSEEVARREAEKIRGRLEARLEALDEEREELLASTRDAIEQEVKATQELLEDARRRIEHERVAAEQAAEAARKAAAVAAVRPKVRPPKPPDTAGLEEAQEKVVATEEAIRRLQRLSRRRRPRRPEPAVAPESVQAGDLVWLRGLERYGEALTRPDERGEFEVRLGPLRSRVSLEQVERVQRPHHKGGAPQPIPAMPPAPAVEPEIEIRGQTIDEALPALDKYLDDAYRAGLSSVRIVHGRGTGVLRKAVRDMLSRHPLVRTVETAPQAEGGEGVTVAVLVG